jgi:hypothetical protein
LIQAQVVHFGVKAGYNTSWIINQHNYGLSELDYELNLAPMFGITAGADYGRHLGFQIELNYAYMGQNYENEIGLPLFFGDTEQRKVRREVDLQYVQVPIMLRYFTGGERSRFVLLVGPQLGIRGFVEQNYFGEDSAVAFGVVPAELFEGLQDQKDYFNAIDLGIAGGFGGEFMIGEDFYFSPALRYYVGLSDINDERTQEGIDNYAASRNAYVGLHFAFGARVDGPRRPTGWRRAPGR